MDKGHYPNNMRTTRYWKNTSDKRRYTTTKELNIKFDDRTAKDNTNFYIQNFLSNEFRFSFANMVSLKKNLQRQLKALNF